KETQERCISEMEEVNNLLRPVFNDNVFTICKNKFNFRNIREPLIYNKFEGQIDTGKMMEALLQKVQVSGVKILNNIFAESFSDNGDNVEVKTDKFQFKTRKLFISSNGFASQYGIDDVKPARAQVLVTKPIKGLEIKGTFHLDKGYYYFRNIDDRILFGGGRNLDLKGEETTEMVQTELIQQRLEELLKSTILPEYKFEIDYSWSGIMGVGSTKKPIVKQLSNHVYCGV